MIERIVHGEVHIKFCMFTQVEGFEDGCVRNVSDCIAQSVTSDIPNGVPNTCCAILELTMNLASFFVMGEMLMGIGAPTHPLFSRFMLTNEVALAALASENAHRAVLPAELSPGKNALNVSITGKHADCIRWRVRIAGERSC